MGFFSSDPISFHNTSVLLSKLNSRRTWIAFFFVERLFPVDSLVTIDRQSINLLKEIDSVEVELSCSIPFPIQYKEIEISRVMDYVREYCKLLPSQLQICHNDSILQPESHLPLDSACSSWKLLLKRKDTSDIDGIAPIHIILPLCLFEGETTKDVFRSIGESMFRICSQTLLFSSDSGCIMQ